MVATSQSSPLTSSELSHATSGAKNLPEHAPETFDRLSEIDRFNARSSSAAEGQDLVNEFGSASRGLTNLTKLRLTVPVVLDFYLEQIRITENRREYVIEIVGHRTRDASQRLESRAALLILLKTRKLGA